MLGDARIFHINVNCRNLDRSRACYEAIGLRAGAHTAPERAQSGTAFGLDLARWDASILVGSQGFEGGAIDLLEWKEPAPTGNAPVSLNTQGWQRVGLLVPDLDRAIQAMAAHGGTVWSEPLQHTEPDAHINVRLVLANDPDGTALELVEGGGPAVTFVGVVCGDLERSVEWYRALGLREIRRFGSANETSAHLRIDGPSAFDEVMLVAPGGGIALMLVGFTTPGVAAVQPRPAHAVGIWRVAFLVPDLDAGCRALAQAGVELMSAPVTMAMGGDLPALRFVCFRGPDHETIELIEQPR